MSQVSIEVPSAIADELTRRAAAEGKTPAELLSEVLGLSDSGPFEFVGAFASDDFQARNVDEALLKLGFGES